VERQRSYEPNLVSKSLRSREKSVYVGVARQAELELRGHFPRLLSKWRFNPGLPVAKRKFGGKLNETPSK
jgi:hypothetical protein